MKIKLEKGLAVILGVTLLFYLAFLNFSVPYVTVDEIRSMSVGYMDHIRNVSLHGRVSFIFSALSNTIIGFADPTIFNLMPRFLSMLLMAYAVFLAIASAGVSRTSAVIAASLIMLIHQLDDWHNGLIAFFSGYALAYGAFVLSIVAANFKINKYAKFIFQYIFALISFSSEIFFGLAFMYLIASTIIYKKKLSHKNPLIYALATYLLLAVIFNVGNHNAEHAAMTHYLAGAYVANSLLDIAKAFFLYMFYSVPFAKAIGLKFGTAVVMGVVMVLIIVASSGYLIYQDLRKRQVNTEGGSGLIVCLALMGIGCEMLVANQPLKYNWIMSGASSRYVFSLYTWVGFALPLVVIFMRSFGFIPRMVLVGILMTYCVFSVSNNLKYIKTYSQSMASWKEIHNLAQKTPTNSLVEIPLNLLKHPGIVQFGPQELSDYIFSNYHKKIAICFDGARINFTSAVNDKQVSMNGFSGPEADGRWTLGKLSDVQIKQQFYEGNRLKLKFSDVFADNADLETIIDFDGQKIKKIIRKDEVIELFLKNDVLNPVIYITVPHPISPDALKMGGDPRNLGLKIQFIEIIADKGKGLTCEMVGKP